MSTTMKFLILFFVPIVTFSCGSDDKVDPYLQYNHIQNIMGYYEGTRTITISGRPVEEETNRKYSMIITSQQAGDNLSVLLGFPPVDNLDRMLTFKNFKTKDGNNVVFMIQETPQFSISSLKGSLIPSFFRTHYQSLVDIVEVRNFRLQHFTPNFNIFRKEITFESKGQFVVIAEDGSQYSSNIEIMYKLTQREL